MELPLVLRGMIIGLGIAAPVGPIGLLCIQRTLNQGQRAGLLAGLGAASADAVYGFAAAFGLTLVTAFLVEQRLWFGIVGGLFLLYLGGRTLLTPPAARAAAGAEGSLWRAYASTFALTLTNPMTILSFVAIFAGAGLAAEAGSAWRAALLVVGVFFGSAAWWLALSSGVARARGRITPSVLRWINRGAGALIFAFGLFALYTTLQPS